MKKDEIIISTFENSSESIIITNSFKTIVLANKTFYSTTDFEESDVLDNDISFIQHKKPKCPVISDLMDMAFSKGRWRGEIWLKSKNGHSKPKLLSINLSFKEDGDYFFTLLFSNLSSIKKQDNYAMQTTFFDTLTGLPNRILFRDRLEQAIASARRNSRLLGVCILDLDSFKKVNESLGHSAGDSLLIEVSKHLKETLRVTDTIAHAGGDEFYLILTDIADTNAISAVAKKIVESFNQPFVIDGYEVVVTMSIGISTFPNDSDSEEQLIKNADAALHHVKESGKNNFQFFSKEMNSYAIEKLEMETKLRKAVEHEELFLLYQPQINIDEGKIIGTEALIRWNNPEKGIIPPLKFIPLAEETGLIVPIGRWVIFEACRQNKIWQEKGLPPIKVSVNISPIQFEQENLFEDIKEALAVTGLSPEYLEVELTESTLMKNAENTIQIINELKKMGVSVSIDDFGTGYSSLSYLKKFNVSSLKIDRSFVKDITTSTDDAAIVRAIINMSHSLNLEVIAEGVETADQNLFLKNAECTIIQGYFFSKPVSAAEIETMLLKGFI